MFAFQEGAGWLLVVDGRYLASGGVSILPVHEETGLQVVTNLPFCRLLCTSLLFVYSLDYAVPAWP